MDEKVENAKAEKVADHFRGGGGFKAEWLLGWQGQNLHRGVGRPNLFMVIKAESWRGGVRRQNLFMVIKAEILLGTKFS